MLQEYQRAREEAKVEIARAQDRLREQTEQEKLRIRQRIISQLLRVGNRVMETWDYAWNLGQNSDWLNLHGDCL